MTAPASVRAHIEIVTAYIFYEPFIWECFGSNFNREGLEIPKEPSLGSQFPLLLQRLL